MLGRHKRANYAISKSPLFGIRGPNELARALSSNVPTLEKFRDSEAFYRLKDKETKPGKSVGSRTRRTS